jgi:Mn2+/Fe2+ NRAMP family transporter
VRVRVPRHAASSASGPVTAISFGPNADRRWAADRAHRGDLEGALGVVSSADTGPRRGARRRLATLAAVLGPGLVVMVADNDAGGISTYAQAGQDYGVRIAWLVVLLVPVLFVNQEMAARLGAVTGAGHARLITERFGRRWGAFALADLLALNLLTLVTEFIGVSMSLGYFGVSRFVSVPVAAAFLIGVTAAGSFRGWERVMYALMFASLVAVPLVVAALARRPTPPLAPTAAGAGHGGAVLLVVALVGTTVAPWQFFFQQSNVVDKRITTRFLGYERADTALGTVLFVVGALGVLLACGFAFGGTALHGTFTGAGAVARGLHAEAGPAAGVLFAIALGVGSVLGASAVTLATSYAVGDYFGLRHSLHRRWREARTFHRTHAVSVLAAAAVVLIPRVPLGLLTTVVQALAGVLLPSATVFLLLLCNDREVLGPLVNPRWLNVLAAAVVGGLLGAVRAAHGDNGGPAHSHHACGDRAGHRGRRAGRMRERRRDPEPARPGTGRPGRPAHLDDAADRIAQASTALAFADNRPGSAALLPVRRDRLPGRAGGSDRAGLWLDIPGAEVSSRSVGFLAQVVGPGSCLGQGYSWEATSSRSGSRVFQVTELTLGSRLRRLTAASRARSSRPWRCSSAVTSTRPVPLFRSWLCTECNTKSSRVSSRTSRVRMWASSAARVTARNR